MNHSFKNLPRAKEVNKQQGTMYSTKAYLSQIISFGEHQQQTDIRAPQPLKGKEENKNIKDGLTEYSKKRKDRSPNLMEHCRLFSKGWCFQPRRPKSIIRNKYDNVHVDWSLVKPLHSLTDDDDDDDGEEEEGEEETFEEFISAEQSNGLNADSHVGSQKKTLSESKADEASSHISIHNETKSSHPKRNARRHHINAYTGRRINGKVICSQDARSYLASFRKKEKCKKVSL